MKKIVLVLSFFRGQECFSQVEMETDRPDQTECSSVVSAGSVQVETGVVYTVQTEKDLPGITSILNTPTTLIRIGIVKSAELRIEAGEYEKGIFSYNDSSFVNEGFIPFQIGTKIAVCEEKGILPQTAFIGHLGLPLGDATFVRTHEIIPSFRFSMSHTLPKNFSVGYNLGMEWESRSNIPSYVYTLTLGNQATEGIYLYIEAFGDLAFKRYPNACMDGGLSVTVFENFKLDISGGVGLNDPSDDHYLSAGAAFRLPH